MMKDTKFIYIDNKCYALTKGNRFKRNWKSHFKESEKSKIGICTECKIEKQLTQHHIIPLTKEPNKKVKWVCRECHNNIHMTDIIDNKSPNFIKCCGKRGEAHKIFFDHDKLMNHCIICGPLNLFQKINEGEYKTLKCLKKGVAT